MEKFRQSSIFLTELQLPSSSIFFAETSHTFATNQCLQKSARNFFLFCVDPELFTKTKNTWFLHTRFLHFY